jgi:hypothetical protein
MSSQVFQFNSTLNSHPFGRSTFSYDQTIEEVDECDTKEASQNDNPVSQTTANGKQCTVEI